MGEKINKKLPYSGHRRHMDAGDHHDIQGFQFFAYCLMPLQFPLAYVKELQEFVASKVYHYQH
jgi:hypothetical protein